MEKLSYSLHLGSNKSSSKGTNSKANNGIQNKRGLSKVDNHNLRKYDKYEEFIYVIRGTHSLVDDVKCLYKELFEESRLEYNKKQTRPSRMIDDYFEHVSKDEKKDLACEIIIELGDKKFWETKSLEYKKYMYDVFYNQLNDLEKVVPNFKIANATLHLDETSPHLHVVGVPVKDKNKYGMSLQVGKSDVFTKESLVKIQDEMRTRCIKEFNEVYKENVYLKEKQKGRNKDYHISEMNDYIETKKELEIEKNSINKSINDFNKISSSALEINNILKDLEKDRIGNYKLSKKQKARLETLLEDFSKMEKEFDKLSSYMTKLNLYEDKTNYYKDNIRKLSREKDQIVNFKDKYEKENHNLKMSKDFLESYKKIKNIEMIKVISEGLNSSNYYKRECFKDIAKELNKKEILSKAEYEVCFKPMFSLNDYEIEKAINKTQQEMEEASKGFHELFKYDDERFL